MKDDWGGKTPMGRSQEEDTLTYGNQILVVLQHHLLVQSPLSKIQPFPLILREVYGHICESHWILKWHKYSPAQSVFMPLLTWIEGKGLCRSHFVEEKTLCVHKCMGGLNNPGDVVSYWITFLPRYTLHMKRKIWQTLSTFGAFTILWNECLWKTVHDI